MVERQRVAERADMTRDSHNQQPGKNKYRGDGSTRRPEERNPRQGEPRRLIPVRM